MPEPILKISVTCPHCALESLADMPIALIANALLIGKAIRLYSRCHNHYWTATFAEREQLRKSLAALKIESHTHRVAPHAEQLETARQEIRGFVEIQ
jgi:hypothetical protein